MWGREERFRGRKPEREPWGLLGFEEEEEELVGSLDSLEACGDVFVF